MSHIYKSYVQNLTCEPVSKNDQHALVYEAIASDFSDEMSLSIPAPVHYPYAKYKVGKAIPQSYVFQLTE